MFEIMTRKISAKGLSLKLNSLGQDERWLYKAAQLTNETYHSAKGLSSTVVKAMADEKTSDYNVYERYVNKSIPRVQTAAFTVGSAFHKIVLEPKDFYNEFIIKPEQARPTDIRIAEMKAQIEKAELAKENIIYWSELDKHNSLTELEPDRKKVTPAQIKLLGEIDSLKQLLIDEDREPKKAEQTKLDKALSIQENIEYWEKFNASQRQPEEGRKRPTANSTNIIAKAAEYTEILSFWADFDKKAKGKELLTQADFDLITEMKKGLMANPEARKLIKEGLPEVSVFFREPVTDLICKARADSLGENCVSDIKTMDDISESSFIRDVIKYGYHIQAAYYLEAFCMDSFKFICQSKKPPYECAVYDLNDEFMEVGHLLVRDAVDRFNDCLEKNKWVSYYDKKNPVKTLACPTWISSKILGM